MSLLKIRKHIGMVAVMLVLALGASAVPALAHPSGGGGGSYSGAVGPYEEQAWSFGLYGGLWARFTVRGNGFTSIQLFVYDAYGNQIASGSGFGTFSQVVFVPPYTGSYTVVVHNHGGGFSDYVLYAG